jgi:drug/metabolite transporter (DMT)-like permease
MTNSSAIGLMCLAVLCFSVLDSTAKYLGEFTNIPFEQVLWLRFLTHCLVLALIYRPIKFIGALKTAAPKAQLVRTFTMLGATAFNFWALKYLQLDQTITIFFLSPLLIAALAGPLLGERLEKAQLLAVIFGFLGVLIVTRPGFGGIHWAVGLSLLATLSLAFYNVFTRYTSKYDNNRTNQVYAPLGGAFLFTPFALAHWQTPESLFIWVLLISLGISGGLGHWLLITAHRHAPAPLLAPFIYLGIISMPIIGYYIFDDIPSSWTLAGALCVIASGLYLWSLEKEKKSTVKNRSVEPPIQP